MRLFCEIKIQTAFVGIMIWMEWKMLEVLLKQERHTGGSAFYSAPSTSSAVARIFSIAILSNWVLFGLIWTIFVPRLR